MDTPQSKTLRPYRFPGNRFKKQCISYKDKNLSLIYGGGIVVQLSRRRTCHTSCQAGHKAGPDGGRDDDTVIDFVMENNCEKYEKYYNPAVTVPPLPLPRVPVVSTPLESTLRGNIQGRSRLRNAGAEYIHSSE